RDTVTRLIYGGRVTLGVAFLTVAVSLTVGAGVGMLAGYYGGWLDDILMRLVDTVLAIPAIFLFILMSILLRPTPISLALVIFPGVTIFITVLASNIFGNAIRDAFDPRLK